MNTSEASRKQENFENILVTPMRELTMGYFTEFSCNFEMPLNPVDLRYIAFCIIFISMLVVLISVIGIP